MNRMTQLIDLRKKKSELIPGVGVIQALRAAAPYLNQVTAYALYLVYNAKAPRPGTQKNRVLGASEDFPRPTGTHHSASGLSWSDQRK